MKAKTMHKKKRMSRIGNPIFDIRFILLISIYIILICCNTILCFPIFLIFQMTVLYNPIIQVNVTYHDASSSFSPIFEQLDTLSFHIYFAISQTLSVNGIKS